jgi:glycosyltransferase involved in cell wall biosynthesis
MNSSSVVSIIIPCRNEVRFIDACLDSVMASDFPKDRLEVLVVDGMSDDGTRAIVGRHAAADGVVRLLDNPDRIAPAALNVGIRSATGNVIVRLDAHCLYPQNYVSSLVEWLDKSGADNVGGICRTRPANETPKAKAIALGLAHPFGVGNSYFRIGAREPRYVDTVPFGCYRRDVFDRIGLFDEDLIRNQDDELNARLIRHGGRILLVPDVVTEYFTRESLGKLWRMYYQYGYFKPLVARKLGRVMTVRQVMPALFVTALVAGPVLSAAIPALRLPFLVMLATYSAANLVFAVRAGWPEGGRCVGWLMAVFVVLHVSYGVGFLKGMLDFAILNRRPGAKLRAMAPSR